MVEILFNFLCSHSKIHRLLISILGILILTGARAEGNSPSFTKPLPPMQRIFIDNTNLTARDFFSAYMSKSAETRRYSELYLLGVLDSTEGVSWCDYRTFKTITLGEEVYLGFKQLAEVKQSARASHIITEILGKKFPCGGK